MSEESETFRSSSDRNRDGIDDDIDRRPGNERESASYARIYDPRSEQEFTNLMEPANQLQQRLSEQRLAARNKALRRAMNAAQSDVHFFPDIGRFIIPTENTWAAHAELVLDNKTDLAFNTDKFAFDRIVASKLNIPALVDRNHPDFSKYRGLRTNLEVLRNDIIGQYLDDGSFDRGDEIYVPIINSIAQVLGDALANDVWWKRPFVNYFSKDVANVEAVGAAEMYKFLLKQQDNPKPNQFFSNLFAPFIKGIRELVGLPDRNWGILPLERTPFSPAALSAPAPNFAHTTENSLKKLENISSPAISETEINKETAQKIVAESLDLINIANNFSKDGNNRQSVENLSTADKAISVEDGRTIIRWLRNLQGIDQDVQDFLDTGTPAEQLAKTESLGKLVKLYALMLAKSPHLEHLPEVKEGEDSAGAVAMMIAEKSMSLFPENNPERALLASAVDSQPEIHFERSHQSTERLLEHIEKGLSILAGMPLGERSAIDRMLASGNNLHKHAKELRAVENLTPPKREESVELGREILRKLRSMTFSDKPMAESLDSGMPEEKASLAEKIEEIAELYKNIVAKAITLDPNLANDQRIKDANDAVGGAAHSIQLMAAKEIPNNIAQTQQIAADVTQMPEEWKNLHGRAVNRLMQTMEGGLEAAVDSINQQEQEQQREEDMAQEAIDAALLNSDNARRRKRKRRSQRSGLGGRKQEKLNRDITADDRAAGQGRFRESGNNNSEEGTLKRRKNAFNLNVDDLDKIKSIGNKLRDVSEQARSLPAIDLSLASDIKPDDKSLAERAIEQAIQSRRNNKKGPSA